MKRKDQKDLKDIRDTKDSRGEDDVPAFFPGLTNAKRLLILIETASFLFL
jgi:hypothetical protein